MKVCPKPTSPEAKSHSRRKYVIKYVKLSFCQKFYLLYLYKTEYHDK